MSPPSWAHPDPACMALVVDLDGTLSPCDTLWEQLVRLAKANPLALLQLPLWLVQGRAVFKDEVSRRSAWAGDALPLDERLMGFLREQRGRGRRLVLATAANERIARNVAGQVGLFDDVIASDEAHNLKGRHKLQAIRERVGSQPFTYAGDSTADLEVWRDCGHAVLVGVSGRVKREVMRTTPIEREFERSATDWRTWSRALRVHQWLKNLLLLVPLLTSFSFADPRALLAATLAFGAFSAVASATYLFNDLWDLDNDRAHPRKRLRPLASGALSIPRALLAATLLLVGGFSAALAVGERFTALLALYLVATSVYSSVLKRRMMADVIMLASLYTLRILAGAAAIGVAVSTWLFAFSVFLFLSLALVKRCAELVAAEQAGQAMPGRGYNVADLRVLWPLGTGASLCCVVVFGLFVNAESTQARYASPQAIWLAGLGLIYWLSRLWLKTSRGEMHDDPIVFALRDRNSLATLGLMALAAVVSYTVPL